MSLGYKFTTTRHDDLPPEKRDATFFYVASYGPVAQLASMHIPKKGRRVVLLHLNDEHATERMDVMVFPEMSVDKASVERFEGHFAWLSDETAGPANVTYRQVLNRGIRPQQHQQQQKERYALMRTCQEHTYRAMVMRYLLYVAQRRRDYRVYAALSPLHERTVVELLQIVNARRASDLDGIMTEQALCESLEYLAQHELVRTAIRMPIGPVHRLSVDDTRIPDYDHCIGRRVREMLKHLFSLAPGTVMTDPAYVEKHRDELRRSVHTYRQERVVEIIQTASARMTELCADITPSSPNYYKVVHARNNSVRRVLLEHEVVRDILRAHHLGAHQGDVATASTTNDSDTIMRKNSLPRPIALIITACSQLPEVPVAASPRSRSNSTGNNGHSGSGHSTPKSNETASTVSSSSLSSNASTPRLCNTWAEYTAIDDDRFHLALARALMQVETQ